MDYVELPTEPKAPPVWLLEETLHEAARQSMQRINAKDAFHDTMLACAFTAPMAAVPQQVAASPPHAKSFVESLKDRLIGFLPHEKVTQKHA